MDWIQELSTDIELKTKLSAFLDHYGPAGLEEALQSYTNLQQKYICKTKKSISIIHIEEIFYLEIQQHWITIHTCYETYQKYGSLNGELKLLANYNFVKCNQSCIVSLNKIRTINGNKIILINGVSIHMSRNYAHKVLLCLSCKIKSK